MDSLQKIHRELRVVLLDDFSFDLVAEWIDLLSKVKKTKRLKARERLPLIRGILSDMAAYIMPKQKVIEQSGDGGGNVTFNIEIVPADPQPLKSAGSGKAKPIKKRTPKKVSIPAIVDADGGVSVSISQ